MNINSNSWKKITRNKIMYEILFYLNFTKISNCVECLFLVWEYRND